MDVTDENPSITPFLRYFTLVETIVLIIGSSGLILIPGFTRAQWPWTIAPFNAGFLGAIYLGAMVSVAYMFLSGRWSPTRPVLRGFFIFTFMVLFVSLLTISEFDNSKTIAFWGWFGLYVALPLSAGIHLWLYRSMPTAHLNPVPRNWSYLMKGMSYLMALYGIGLMVFPDIFSSLFPWKLDVFHSKLYSAIFITGFVMLITISKFATPAEFIAVGLTEATFGITSIIELIIVDTEIKKIDWSASSTIGWLSMLAVFALLGISLVWAGANKIPKKEDN